MLIFRVYILKLKDVLHPHCPFGSISVSTKATLCFSLTPELRALNKNPFLWMKMTRMKFDCTVDGSEIRRSPVEVGDRLSPFFTRFIYPRWLFGISEPSTVEMKLDMHNSGT